MGWPPERWREGWIPNSFRGYSAWPYSPIQDDENHPLDRCRTRQWFGMAWAMAVFTLNLVAVMMLFGGSRDGNLPILATTQESEVSPTNVKLRVYNTYTKDHPIQHYPWEHIAEPYRATLLEIQSWPGWEDNVDYRWDMEGETRGYGAYLETLFDMPGVYQCVVTATPRSSSGAHLKVESAYNEVAPDDSDTEVAAIYRFSVNVKYIRREIRQLTDRDREAFFNAVSVMQRVPSVVGRVLYGDKYYSKDYFNRLHMYYGCGRECDHWHDGAGFVTSHISLTLMYEQSLQAINPSIAVPYWDFTIEGTLYGGPDFRDSEVFSDDWFGTPRPDNVARTPDRGRFAYVPVMTNASGYSIMTNAYGLLRSPWNTDENPFLTRHDHIFGFLNDMSPSGCMEYQETLSMNTWMTLSEMLNSEAHGHIHELIGGSWSEEFGRVTMGVTDAVLPFLHTIQPHTKSLWRSGYFNCPVTCGVQVPWHQCTCTCNAEAMHGMTPSEVLQDSGILEIVSFYDRHSKIIESFVDEEGNVFYTLPGYTLDETKEIFSQLLTVLCSPARIGTNYEGSSTNDVIFWVLHPTIDRAWHFSRLTSRNFKHGWRSGHECYGHNPNDTQPFHDLFPLADAGLANHRDVSATTTSRKHRFPSGKERLSGKLATTFMRLSESQRTEDTKNEAIQRRLDYIEPPKHYYSNAELYEMLRPDRWEMPYVYDNFEWPHCEAIGISMAVVP